MPHLRHLRPKPEPVVLGDDVWIGTRAIILAGVKIGSSSVIAAGSVVTKDVPPLTVVAGAPEQAIRKLNDHFLNLRDEAYTSSSE
jgi:acetyltransferase-like isoleucine patch superfamily enzyme